MTEEAQAHLRRCLMKLGPGNVQGSEVREVENLLAELWFDLAGRFEGGMVGYKLHGRTEGLFWNPPELSFTIERHGGAVMGSVYAELQHWVVDVSKGSAWVQSGGRRLIGRRAKPLKVVPLVEEVVELVGARANDARLKWQTPDRVRIMIGQIIPSESAVAQTLQGRRRRFSNELEKQMRAMGWEKVPRTAPHTYSRSKASGPIRPWLRP